MKNIIKLFVFMQFFISCSPIYEQEVISSEIITTNVTIESIHVLKYSKVYSTFIYNEFIYHTNNGHSGYYYKKFNLKSGQVLPSINVVLKKIKYYNSDTSFIEIKPGIIEFKNYIIN